jgi:NADPH:quinone reductase-like Zn-dependent oxidoreductase
MNETMTATLIREHGGPEQMRVETVKRPQPAPGEALVRLATR